MYKLQYDHGAFPLRVIHDVVDLGDAIGGALAMWGLCFADQSELLTEVCFLVLLEGRPIDLADEVRYH